MSAPPLACDRRHYAADRSTSLPVALLDKLRSWYNWTSIFRILGEVDWLDWMVPSVCIVNNSFKSELLLRASIPLVLICVIPILGGIIQALKETCRRTFFEKDQWRTFDTHRWTSLASAASYGVTRSLSIVLLIAFCFTPNVSMYIFLSWDCVAFTYDERSSHSYLEKNLAVRCDGSDEHSEILMLAWALVGIWPIGMVVLYAVLLRRCHTLLLKSESHAPLVHATAFLHKDYKLE